MPRIGYFEWLKSEGVVESFEYSYGFNTMEANNVYSFSTQVQAESFRNKYLIDNHDAEVLFDPRLGGYVILITPEAQQSLKEQFENTHPQSLTIIDCDRQLEAIHYAQRKVRDFNEPKDKSPAWGRTNRHQVGNRLGEVSSLLSNLDDNEGLDEDSIEWSDAEWETSFAVSAMDLVLTAYSATNSYLLSKEESNLLDNTQKSILVKNDKGKFIGGLKIDNNFTDYIQEQYGKDYDQEIRTALVKENVNQLLNGGPRLAIDRNTQGGMETFIVEANNPNFYLQPSFFQIKMVSQILRY